MYFLEDNIKHLYIKEGGGGEYKEKNINWDVVVVVP